MFTYPLQLSAIQRSATVSSQNRGWSCSLNSYNTHRSRCQQQSHPRTVVGHVHLPPTPLSDPDFSNTLIPQSWFVMFTYHLQHSAIQRSATVSSQNRDWSCSLTRYNSQRSRGQQQSHPRTVVGHVHLTPTTLTDPDVSNSLIPEPWLVMFTYLLHHSAIQTSATRSSPNRGLSCSLTTYNTQRSRGQQQSHPRTVVGHVHLPPTTLSDPEVSNSLIPEPWLVMFT